MNLVDPYYQIAEHLDFVDIVGSDDDRVHVTLIVDNNFVIEDFRGKFKRSVVITQGGTVVTALVQRDDFRGLAMFAGVVYAHFTSYFTRADGLTEVGNSRPSGDHLQEASAGHTATGDADSASSGAVLVGVIDTGCPFAHEQLRSADGLQSRVRAIWDQGGEFLSGSAATYGSVLRKPVLDAALATYGSASVDEPALYRRFGMGELSLPSTHGAAICGIVSNYANPEASTPELAFVQLPRDLLSSPCAPALGGHAIDAIEWILAQRRGSENRVVVVFPYESRVGPHDGTSPFSVFVERKIAEMSNLDVALNVVVPVGNNYRAQGHQRIDVGFKGSWNQGLLVRHDSVLPTWIEMWGAFKDINHISEFTLTSPDSETVVMKPSSTTPQSTTTAVLAISKRDDAFHAVVRIAPTKNSSGPSATPGAWRLSANIVSPLSVAVDFYIARTEGAMNYASGGKQAEFVDPLPVGLDGQPIGGSLSCFATGAGVVAVGACLESATDTPSDYSAAGPSRDGGVPGPAYSASVEPSLGGPGLQVIGTFSNTFERVQGTSFAAAKVAASLIAGSRLPSEGNDARLGTLVS